jgi:hypothetical protein
MQLVAVQVKMRCGGNRNAGMGAAMVKLPKYDGSMSWTVFHWQFQNVFDHIGGGAPVEAMHLLTILQVKLLTFYIVYEPKWHMRISFRCGRTVIETMSLLVTTENLEAAKWWEFAAGMEHLAHQALAGLLEDFRGRLPMSLLMERRARKWNSASRLAVTGTSMKPLKIHRS